MHKRDARATGVRSTVEHEPLTTVENPIALVLGGGGARGLAHIGVVKAMEESGVPIDMIVGTSVGALGAGAYAMDPDWKHVREKSFAFLRSKGFAKYGKGLTDSATGQKKRPPHRIKMFLLKWGALTALLARRSLFPHKKLRDGIEHVIPDATFADTTIPAAFVALDLKSAKEVVLRTGSLRKAALASASLAGFFPPVTIGDWQLVDPSPVSSVPVSIARSLGAAGVIAVDIRSRVLPSEGIDSGADAVFRVAAMASERSNDVLVQSADVVIAPDVAKTYWSDFHNLDGHVEEGERAALEVMPAIRDLLARLGRAR
jgi:NTE family protein